MKHRESGMDEQVTGPTRNFRDHVSVLLATGLGVGRTKYAPGTLGTFWGIPITLALAHVEPWWCRAVLILLLCLAGVYVCGRAAAVLGKKDPGAVIWDEFVTLPLVFLWLPLPYWRGSVALMTGLVLHRIFDIWKLPPVNHAERLPAGWGIMLDDVMAAIYASGVLWIIYILGWLPGPT